MRKNLLTFILTSSVLLSSCGSTVSKVANRTTRGDERSLEIVQAIQASFKENGGEEISYYYQGPTDSYSIIGAVKKSDADLETLMEHSSAYLLDGWVLAASSSFDERKQTYSMKYSYDSNDISVTVTDYEDQYDSDLNDIEFSVKVSGSTYSRATTYGNADCLQTIQAIGIKMFGVNDVEKNYAYDYDEDYYYAIGVMTTGNSTMLSLIRKATNYLPSGVVLKSSPEYNSSDDYYKAVYTYETGAITINAYTYKDTKHATYVDLQFSVFLSEVE